MNKYYNAKFRPEYQCPKCKGYNRIYQRKCTPQGTIPEFKTIGEQCSYFYTCKRDGQFLFCSYCGWTECKGANDKK